MLSSWGDFSFFAFLDLIAPVCKFMSSCGLALTPASCLAKSCFAPASRHRPEIDALAHPQKNLILRHFGNTWGHVLPSSQVTADSVELPVWWSSSTSLSTLYILAFGFCGASVAGDFEVRHTEKEMSYDFSRPGDGGHQSVLGVSRKWKGAHDQTNIGLHQATLSQFRDERFWFTAFSVEFLQLKHGHLGHRGQL